jgi:uncharacterized protein (DUF1499 family)
MTAEVKIVMLLFSGLFFAIVSVVGAMLAGFGSRWGWWYFRTGFVILRWSGYCAIIGLFACCIGLIGTVFLQVTSGLVFAVIGLVMGSLVAGTLSYWKLTLKRLPMIHDITTDTENPPRFKAILALRKDAENPAEYGGPEIAAQQQKAYPDMVPLVMNAHPDAVFATSVAAAKKMKWALVDANKYEGRIEASDTTFWFGFKDDIVIRITPQGNGSRIDMRSVSRVGRSDLGKNASRIRAFLKLLSST